MKSSVRQVGIIVITWAFIIFMFKVIELTALRAWEVERLGFRLTGHIIMLIIAITSMAFSREKLKDFGVTVSQIPSDVRNIKLCFLLVLPISLSLHIVSWQKLNQVWIVVLIEIISLIFIYKQLARGTKVDSNVLKDLVILGLIILLGSVAQWWVGRSFSEIIRTLMFFLLFASAEELLFRGYIQTNLQLLYSKQMYLFGVQISSGMVFSAVLFGMMHVLNPFNPLTSHYELAWTWGGLDIFFRIDSWCCTRES